jgi:hypothetical protein
MLRREELTDAEWLIVRNAPHHVALAVSASEGSLLDEMLERAAALAGIVDAANSRYSLLSGIAAGPEIMAAQDQLRAWIHGLDDSERTPARLQDKAMALFRDAINTLHSRGGHDDVEHYCAFVIGLATRVARAAREGDLLGFGGQLMSGSEQSFIAKLEQVVVSTRR